MALKLKWLQLKSFRSFVDETRVDFPESGLVLLRGSNPVTHDSSGAGKSTLLLAISYALDMCPLSATDLQSWNTEEPLQVTLALDTDEGEVVIHRGKKNSISIAGKNYTGAKVIAENLRRVVGLDADTLRTLTYRPQDSRGVFLSLADAGKKEFLSSILGLTDIEQAVESAEATAKQLTQTTATEEAACKEMTGMVAMLSEQLKGLPQPQETPPSPEALRLVVDDLDSRVQEAWATAERLKDLASQNPELTKMRDLLRAAQSHRERMSQEDTQLRREFSKKQEKLRQELQVVIRAEAQKNHDLAQIAQNRAQLEKARQGACVTCQRPWDQSQAYAAQLEHVTVELEKRVVAAEEVCGSKRALEEELRKIFTENPLIRQFSDNISMMDRRIHEKALESAAGAVTEAQEKVLTLKQQKSEVLSQINGIEFQIKSVQQSNARIEVSRKQFTDTLTQNQNRLQARQTELNRIRVELAAELDFVAAMGPRGFLGAIFEEVLSEIEAEANERLGRLANVSHLTVHFSTETVTQKGVVNKAILTTVFVDGKEAKLKTLSGGQFTSLDGVVDLAVGAVIQRRSGVVPGWLCLDECWNGQGVATKENDFDVLREYACDRLVLVIDHTTEVVEAFNQIIEVEYVDGKSRIK